MNKHIQTGSIGAAPVLRSTQNHLGIGGTHFFYPEDDGGTQVHGGQGGQGQDGASNQQGGQQQQQQQSGQQQEQYQSPLATLDLDMLDETTRAAVEKANAEIARFRQEAQQGRQFQSRYDQLVAQQQQQQNGQQQQNRNQNQNQGPTFEEELEQIYINEGGMQPAQAKAVAKLNARIFGSFSNRVGGFVNSQTGPLAQNVALHQASALFQDFTLQSQRMSNPDVAQKVWVAVESAVKAGEQITPEMLESLSKIYYVDIMETQGHNSGNQQRMFQPQFQQQQQQQSNGNGSTRYTFPGAGHMVVRPLATRPNSDLDAETQSAVNATKIAMGQSFNWATGGGGKQKVTRGGHR